MICRVFSARNNDGWVLRMECDAQPLPALAERTVRAINSAASPLQPSLPLPPSSESPRWTGKPHAVICDANDYQTIDAVYRRILDNNPRIGEVALFGDYLTAVLLGPNLDILEALPGPVDLRLSFDDPSLQRLPFEMMYGPAENPQAAPNAPLSARPNRRFFINREVPLAVGELPRSKPTCQGRLRVLFVAESKIDNVLRPGAEFLGLLRHLRIPVDAKFEKDFVGADIQLRFLPEGDIAQLQEDCRQFQPSVLHFICHGQSDPGGGASRIRLRERPFGAREGPTQPRAFTADELAGLLTENGGSMPPVIVLNACYTGAQSDQPLRVEDAHLPFAARLVQRGAAIAVGMAGEVADPACQMFTLRFYQALLTQTPLVEAASQARRAVLNAWPLYQQSIEWSRPVLFIAGGLDGTIDIKRDTAFDLPTVGERFRNTAGPKFMCDRYDMIVAYERLMALTAKPDKDKLMVAFAVQEATKGLGRTRLLEEFALRSVADRFVPCFMVRKGEEAPRSLLDFSLALSDALDDTRRKFGAKELPLTEARKLAMSALTVPAAPENYDSILSDLRNFIGSMRNVSPRTIRDAIRKDLAVLLTDITAVTQLPHRALVLLDNFEQWEGAYKDVLESIEFVGLGTPDQPVPVVLNYAATNLLGQSIKATLRSLPPERHPELRRFDSEVERDLVYRQLLLSEWRCAPKQSRDLQDQVKRFLSDLHSKTGGVPSMFLTPAVESFIDTVVRYGSIIANADYETALRSCGV